MGKLKVGIIGCGGIANQKHFPALKNNADLAEMVAFCDIIEERATKAAEEYGVEGAKVYTDYRELLADPEIDIVHICTPNVSHSKIAVPQSRRSTEDGGCMERIRNEIYNRISEQIQTGSTELTCFLRKR